MSARDEAVEMIRRICPPHLSADEYGQILAEKFDAHRADALVEAEVEIRLAAERNQAEHPDEAAMVTRRLGMRAAERVVRGMREETERESTPVAAPDFFQPGRTYTEDAPFRAPEIRPNFRCVAVAAHPTKGSRRAFGFEQSGAGAPWVSAALRDEEWADGWVIVPEGGES
ncbi:hypothetical protein SGLAM104S_01575 [Streptomyces glaucescens]